MTYLHPSLEPVLKDSMGVILYQEQVMRIAIEVAGFSPADCDGFRRAMGTWRSTREMEKLHQQFHDGCMRQPGMTEEMAEELFRQVAAFASFGFAKSHAAAFARTAYESSFLKLFYPAQFLVGLINAQPMGFYPVEVLVNDAKRHGVAVLPVDVNHSRLQDRRRSGWAAGWAMRARPMTRHRRRPGAGAGACLHAVGGGARAMGDRGRDRLGRPPRAWAREGDRRGARRSCSIGSSIEARTRASRTSSSGRDCRRRTLERLIRVGGLDSLGRPRRELLWQLREVRGLRGRRRAPCRVASPAGRWISACRRRTPRRSPA